MHLFRKILKYFKIIAKKLIIFIISVATYILVPPFFVCAIPIYLFRYFIFKTASFFRPDLAKMLSTRSSLVASDDIYGKPNINLIVVLEVDGAFDIERARSEVAKTVWAKDKNGLIHPELQQCKILDHLLFRKIQNLGKKPIFFDILYNTLKYSKNFSRNNLKNILTKIYLTSFMGFYFWKQDPNFQLNEHVFNYEGEGCEGIDGIIYDKQLVKIAKLILSKPHRRNKPLWEMIIVRNYKSCDDPDILKSVIIYRVHHCLADGFSLVKLLLHVIGKKATVPFTIPEDTNSFYQKILNKISFLIRVPLEFMPTFLTSFDLNEWKHPEWKMTKEIKAGMSPRVSMDMLKEIKAIHQVSVTSVIIAAITGAIRNFMILKGVENIPKIVHVGIPLPIPGHPDRLRNHMTICIIPLPVGKSDPIDRLKTLNKCLEKMKNSTIPTIAFGLMPLLGALFPWMSKMLFRNFLTTSLMTSFPGPKDPRFLGFPISNISVGSGLLPGSTAIGFTTLSYKGYLKIICGADKKIIKTDAEAQEVIHLILKEFQILLGTEKV